MSNSTIKKQFVELAAILEAEENQNKKVKSILPQLLELMTKANSASGASHTFKRDEEGNVTEIFCYYHKEWEVVADVEYGTKKNTATGLNTMCKQGVSNWTKQQRAKKQAESALLADLAAGKVAIEDLPAKQEAIAEAAKEIKPLEL